MIIQQMNFQNQPKVEISKGFGIGFIAFMTISVVGIYILKKSKESQE